MANTRRGGEEITRQMETSSTETIMDTFVLASGRGSCFPLRLLADKQITERSSMAETKSEFARKLASDEKLAAWCEEVAESIRAAVSDDIKATESSEQLTREDFAVYINARTDNSLYPTE